MRIMRSSLFYGFERSGFFWLIVHLRANASAWSLLLFMINIVFIISDTGMKSENTDTALS